MTLSENASNRIVFVLALIGAVIALYLTLAHWNVLALTCGEMRGCEEVAAHPVARGFGIPGLDYIPTALFGLLMFLSVATLSFLRVVLGARAARIAARLQLAIVVASIAVFAYLTYLEAFVIRAWCQWCLASSVVTVLMLPALLLARSSPTEKNAP